MKTYDKAVRDRIPEIIQRSGKTCVTEVLPPAAFELKLREKLQEEVDEFLRSGSVEELADVVEVVPGFWRCAAWRRSGLRRFAWPRRKSGAASPGGSFSSPYRTDGAAAGPQPGSQKPFGRRDDWRKWS